MKRVLILSIGMLTTWQAVYAADTEAHRAPNNQLTVPHFLDRIGLDFGRLGAKDSSAYCRKDSTPVEKTLGAIHHITSESRTLAATIFSELPQDPVATEASLYRFLAARLMIAQLTDEAVQASGKDTYCFKLRKDVEITFPSLSDVVSMLQTNAEKNKYTDPSSWDKNKSTLETSLWNNLDQPPKTKWSSEKSENTMSALRDWYTALKAEQQSGNLSATADDLLQELDARTDDRCRQIVADRTYVIDSIKPVIKAFKQLASEVALRDPQKMCTSARTETMPQVDIASRHYFEKFFELLNIDPKTISLENKSAYYNPDNTEIQKALRMIEHMQSGCQPIIAQIFADIANDAIDIDNLLHRFIAAGSLIKDFFYDVTHAEEKARDRARYSYCSDPKPLSTTQKLEFPPLDKTIKGMLKSQYRIQSACWNLLDRQPTTGWTKESDKKANGPDKSEKPRETFGMLKTWLADFRTHQKEGLVISDVNVILNELNTRMHAHSEQISDDRERISAHMSAGIAAFNALAELCTAKPATQTEVQTAQETKPSHTESNEIKLGLSLSIDSDDFSEPSEEALKEIFTPQSWATNASSFASESAASSSTTNAQTTELSSSWLSWMWPSK